VRSPGKKKGKKEKVQGEVVKRRKEKTGVSAQSRRREQGMGRVGEWTRRRKKIWNEVPWVYGKHGKVDKVWPKLQVERLGLPHD